MLSAERNELITRSGPGTPLGALLRRYWQPAALVDQLNGDRPVTRVRLLGEEFVLLRDAQGRYGLLDKHCAHRGADLSFGRVEDGGLRCPFHGWLFDVGGACLEQPAEPEGSTFCSKVRQPSYPCVERNGIVFAYLGPGEPPALPGFDCFVAPDAYTFAFKGLIECNWLQALEVGIDPAHASFLHRFFEDEDTAGSYGKQFRGATLGADMPMTRILRDFPRPAIEVEETEYGLRIAALRQLTDTEMHIRVTNLAFPQAFVIPMSKTMTITQWHVPVDDTHCYWYAIFTSFDAPVDKEQMRAQRLELYQLPDYVPRKNRSNDYGFDPTEQRTSTYTGMGTDINVHDQWAVESMGAIQDRTKEHLGQTDKAITRYRRMLLKAIEDVAAGEAPLLAVGPDAARRITGPGSIDAIGPVEGWQSFWQDQDRRRREAAAWPAAALQSA
ncbi:MAG TPA: aromatic ring-hydroxylating dioxygenase subunit alpha [Stellaceae bacterium]|nr:aromatic ring-hydroxylating dioxygenase subunit alpha [Stellaceae bacterium]